MPTKVNEKLTPTAGTLKACQRFGASPEFVMWELPNMIRWWINFHDIAESNTDKKKGEKTPRGWQQAICNWMNKAHNGSAGKRYENEKEAAMSNRRGGFKADVFDNALDKLQGNPPKVKPKAERVYRKPTHQEPPKGEAMTSEQAFDTLRKQGHLR